MEQNYHLNCFKCESCGLKLSTKVGSTTSSISVFLTTWHRTKLRVIGQRSRLLSIQPLSLLQSMPLEKLILWSWFIFLRSYKETSQNTTTSISRNNTNFKIIVMQPLIYNLKIVNKTFHLWEIRRRRSSCEGSRIRSQVRPTESSHRFRSGKLEAVHFQRWKGMSWERISSI